MNPLDCGRDGHCFLRLPDRVAAQLAAPLSVATRKTTQDSMDAYEYMESQTSQLNSNAA